jgi:cell pole-organizing protein PopZ
MAGQADEPSVEEILASIKQVMARDRGRAVDDGRRDEPPHDDVLELTDAIDPAAEAPLLGGARQASLRGSLSVLANLADPDALGAPLGNAQIEALARELLRPMLAQWLDANLPPLVERMVAAEIARIVGKGG